MTATFKRRCDGQPNALCDNPACAMDCQFNYDETPLQTAMNAPITPMQARAHHAAAVRHTETDYSLPLTMAGEYEGTSQSDVDDLNARARQRRESKQSAPLRLLGWAIALVLCAAAGVMIFGTK